MKLVNDDVYFMELMKILGRRIISKRHSQHNGVIVTTFLDKSVTYETDVKSICDVRVRKRKPFTFEEKF